MSVLCVCVCVLVCPLSVSAPARHPDPLRPAPQRFVAVGVHVPQTVLGGGETLAEEQVGGGPGADVRDAPTVAEDIDGSAEAGQVSCRGDVGQRLAQRLWFGRQIHDT